MAKFFSYGVSGGSIVNFLDLPEMFVFEFLPFLTDTMARSGSIEIDFFFY